MIQNKKIRSKILKYLGNFISGFDNQGIIYLAKSSSRPHYTA
jgi:hypothetical protein